MSIIDVLLALNQNNEERNKVDPEKQLAVIYREVRELKSTILAAEKELDHMAREYQARTQELDRLLLNVPRWAANIAKAKERMVRQRGLTLKDMLEIQQEVARAEENQLLGEAKSLDLRNKMASYENERAVALTRLKGLKAQFNRRAAYYNQEKAAADLITASLTSKEEGLLAELDSETASMYKDALKTNPASPVAALEKDICGGCRIGLSKETVKRVKQGDKPVVCENCLRIVLPDHRKESM